MVAGVVHYDPEFSERPVCNEMMDARLMTATAELVTCKECEEVVTARVDRAQARWNALQPPLPEMSWQPSGYVNAYRLQPYQNADVFEALSAADCWTNEMNETARLMLADLTWLVVGVVGLVILVVLAAAGGGLR